MPRSFFRINGHIDAWGAPIKNDHLPVQEALAYGVHAMTKTNCDCQ
jgi:hypothetical protein